MVSRALFNLLVDAINLAIEGILTVLKEVMKFIFSIITEAAKALWCYGKNI